MYEWSAKHACRNARDEQSDLSVGIVVCVLLSSMRKMSHHLPCKDTNSWQLNVFCESPCKFYSECSWFRSSGDSLLFQYKQNRAACVFACVCVCVCVCVLRSWLVSRQSPCRRVRSGFYLCICCVQVSRACNVRLLHCVPESTHARVPPSSGSSAFVTVLSRTLFTRVLSPALYGRLQTKTPTSSSQPLFCSCC